MPTPNGGSPPTHPQNMKPRPEGSPSLAVLSNHHGVGGPTQALTHGGGYPVYQNSGGHQPPLQVRIDQCVNFNSCFYSACSYGEPEALCDCARPTGHGTVWSLPQGDQIGPLSQTKLFSQAREGPALSCNFCWNTTDGSGRILRRKTKYHCPECQTNLCIVPCFQQVRYLIII